MSRIIISAGHTSSSPGTVIGDLQEFEVARNIAKRITKKLREKGIITLSVPYDLDLQKRIDWINNTGYTADNKDLLIEIHSNEGGKSGVEAWYVDTNKDSKLLADQVTTEINRATGLKIQGVMPEHNHDLGGIEIIRRVNPISILLECLYMDNSEDVKFLRSEEKLDSLGTSIANGIAIFLGLGVSSMNNDTVKLTDNNKAANHHRNDERKGTDKNNNKGISSDGDRGEAEDRNRDKDEESKEEKNESKNIKTDNDLKKDDDQTYTDNNKGKSPTEKPFARPKPSNFLNNTNNKPRPDTNNFGMGSLGSNNSGGFGNSSSSFGGFDSDMNMSGTGGSSMGGIGNSGMGAGNKPTMSRDDRKLMINKYYKIDFGKEPSQSDLNYFLNIGVSEEQFLKRILESQEHVDMVENSVKYLDLKKKYDEVSMKHDQLKTSHTDQRNILDRLNKLLEQKNIALTQMQQRIQSLTNKIEEIQLNSKSTKAKVDYERQGKDKIFDFLSRRLG